jgi:hypothetical protein
MLAVSMIAYGGRFSRQERQTVLKKWQAVLEKAEIEFFDNFSLSRFFNSADGKQLDEMR